jgi:hypothetical protein
VIICIHSIVLICFERWLMIVSTLTILSGFTDTLRCSFGKIKDELNFMNGTTYGLREKVQEQLAMKLNEYLEAFLRIQGFDDSSCESRLHQFKRYVIQESEMLPTAARVPNLSVVKTSANPIERGCIAAIAAPPNAAGADAKDVGFGSTVTTSASTEGGSFPLVVFPSRATEAQAISPAALRDNARRWPRTAVGTSAAASGFGPTGQPEGWREVGDSSGASAAPSAAVPPPCAAATGGGGSGPPDGGGSVQQTTSSSSSSSAEAAKGTRVAKVVLRVVVPQLVRLGRRVSEGQSGRGMGGGEKNQCIKAWGRLRCGAYLAAVSGAPPHPRCRRRNRSSLCSRFQRPHHHRSLLHSPTPCV